MPEVIPWWQQDWYVQNAYNPDLPPISTPPPSTVNMWSGEAPSGRPAATPYPTYTPTNTAPNEWMLPNNAPNYFGGSAPNFNFGQVDIGPWNEPGPLPEPGQGVPSTTATGDYGPGSIGDVPGGDVPLLPANPAAPAPGSPGPVYPSPPSDWSSPTNWANVGQGLSGAGRGLRNLLGNFFPGNRGGFGEPAGYFPPGSTPVPGSFGIVNPSSPAGGGSYFGGRSNPSMWLPGSTYNLGGGGPVNLSAMGGWSRHVPWYIGRQDSPINYGGHSTDAPTGYRLSPAEHAWLVAGGVHSGTQGPGVFSNYPASANAVDIGRERSGAGLGGAGRPMTKPT